MLLDTQTAGIESVSTPTGRLSEMSPWNSLLTLSLSQSLELLGLLWSFAFRKHLKLWMQLFLSAFLPSRSCLLVAQSKVSTKKTKKTIKPSLKQSLALLFPFQLEKQHWLVTRLSLLQTKLHLQQPQLLMILQQLELWQ